MAIERMEAVAEEIPEEGMEEASAVETALLPATILAGQTVAPGDIVRMEVVEVGEDGSVSVKYAASPKPSEPKARGESAIAAAFE